MGLKTTSTGIVSDSAAAKDATLTDGSAKTKLMLLEGATSTQVQAQAVSTTVPVLKTVLTSGNSATTHPSIGSTGDGDTNTTVLFTGARGSTYNGTTWDSLRSASAADSTAGTGLLGTGVLGYDGINYKRIICAYNSWDSKSTASNSLFVSNFDHIFNGTTFDRARGDANKHQCVNMGGLANLATGQVAIDDTAGGTLIKAANTSRKVIHVENIGANAVYVGASGVAANTGYKIGSGYSHPFINTGALYAICAAGQTTTICYSEE